jgi:hypothetical protein
MPNSPSRADARTGTPGKRLTCRGVLVHRPPYKAEGHGFEPCPAHHQNGRKNCVLVTLKPSKGRQWREGGRHARSRRHGRRPEPRFSRGRTIQSPGGRRSSGRRRDWRPHRSRRGSSSPRSRPSSTGAGGESSGTGQPPRHSGARRISGAVSCREARHGSPGAGSVSPSMPASSSTRITTGGGSRSFTTTSWGPRSTRARAPTSYVTSWATRCSTHCGRSCGTR